MQDFFPSPVAILATGLYTETRPVFGWTIVSFFQPVTPMAPILGLAMSLKNIKILQFSSFWAPYFSYFIQRPFYMYSANMANFVVLKHPVTILVTDSANPDNLTNDLLILN